MNDGLTPTDGLIPLLHGRQVHQQRTLTRIALRATMSTIRETDSESGTQLHW